MVALSTAATSSSSGDKQPSSSSSSSSSGSAVPPPGDNQSNNNNATTRPRSSSSGSTSPKSGNASANGNASIIETYRGTVRTSLDALMLFEACRIGRLRRVQRRLSERERSAIKSGSVFVWDEQEAAMRRWTDGRSWSASRVNGPFLVYREMEGRRHSNNNGSTEQHELLVPENNDENKFEDGLDGYRYKQHGLVKQSFSVSTMEGARLHLIAYIEPTLSAASLPQPSSDPTLTDLQIPSGLYLESSSGDLAQHVLQNPLVPNEIATPPPPSSSMSRSTPRSSFSGPSASSRVAPYPTSSSSSGSSGGAGGYVPSLMAPPMYPSYPGSQPPPAPPPPRASQPQMYIPPPQPPYGIHQYPGGYVFAGAPPQAGNASILLTPNAAHLQHRNLQPVIGDGRRHSSSGSTKSDTSSAVKQDPNKMFRRARASFSGGTALPSPSTSPLTMGFRRDSDGGIAPHEPQFFPQQQQQQQQQQPPRQASISKEFDPQKSSSRSFGEDARAIRVLDRTFIL